MSVGRGFAAGLLLFAAATTADARDLPQMPFGRAVSPPAGYQAFCRREPQDCPSTVGGGSSFWGLAFGIRRPGATTIDPPSSIRSAVVAWRRPRPNPSVQIADAPPKEGRVPLSSETQAVIDGVNRQVNRSLAAASDWKIYGRRDYWALPLSRPGRAAGDCEDFVMEKRHRLLAAGFPMAQLSIALLRTRWGETHAVLLVETDEGALVLDNRSDEVRPWWRAKERWIMRQSPENPGTWVAVTTSGADRRAG
jgi:predicted transglutaminase-like cysteine proteinase